MADVAMRGPDFSLVHTVDAETFERMKGGKLTGPILVKGACNQWPAYANWSFENLSNLRKPNGEEAVVLFQNGLTEQGYTAAPLHLPISPYLRELAEASKAPVPADRGLLTEKRFVDLKPCDTFKLNWAYMKSFKPTRTYLAQWSFLHEFEHLNADFRLRDLWGAWRLIRPHTFIGPAQTVTGFHYDYNDNWFCQLRGVKEFLLFPHDQTPNMSVSRKYDWGACLSDVNITCLDELGDGIPERFERAKGFYARIEPGDALYVPGGCWHSVIALTPSVSISAFGLTFWQIITKGVAMQFLDLLHWLGLWRSGHCTCHKSKKSAS